MSYSFSVSGANREEVRERIAEQFDTVVQQQPAHEADREASQNTAYALLDVLGESALQAGQQINVTIYGSLSQRNADDPAKRQTTSVSVNVSVAVA